MKALMEAASSGRRSLARMRSKMSASGVCARTSRQFSQSRLRAACRVTAGKEAISCRGVHARLRLLVSYTAIPSRFSTGFDSRASTPIRAPLLATRANDGVPAHVPVLGPLPLKLHLRCPSRSVPSRLFSFDPILKESAPRRCFFEPAFLCSYDERDPHQVASRDSNRRSFATGSTSVPPLFAKASGRSIDPFSRIASR